MNESEEPDVIQACDFCGSTSDEVENLFVGPGGSPIICDRCVRVCDAMIVDMNIPLNYFCRIPGNLHDERKEKLRPITRIPKSWVICSTDLCCSTPNVTGCSPDGNKSERFSIPKQLAHRMIARDERLDVEELRKKIKEDMARTVNEALSDY